MGDDRGHRRMECASLKRFHPAAVVLFAAALMAQTGHAQPAPPVKGEVLETQNVDSYT